VENDCALVFINGKLDKSVSSGGKAYLIEKKEDKIVKTEI
jgi:hypothetical protein